MRYEESLTEDSHRALSVDSEDGGTADSKRVVSASLSDPFTASRQDSDLPPTGHVRVKAKYDSYDGQQEGTRVAGRRAARDQPSIQQEDGADGQRRRQTERKSSLTGMLLSDVQSFPWIVYVSSLFSIAVLLHICFISYLPFVSVYRSVHIFYADFFGFKL